MHDPREGITARGTIETGARRDRIPVHFQPVVDAALVALRALPQDPSVYVYGSVATGVAQVGISDVDLLTVGLPSTEAAEIAQELSIEFSDICRAVEIAVAQPGDFQGEADEAYGGRVFLRHYCVHLAGADLHSALPEFPADARAVRGFNGDIDQHAQRWRRDLDNGFDPAEVGRRLARKSLLAVAGLVSVRDATWTTDRTTAASRWAELEPALAADLGTLGRWADGIDRPDRLAVEAALEGVVTQIIASFETSIGLWDSGAGSQVAGVRPNGIPPAS